MNASMNESNEEYLRAFDEAQDESEKDNGAESLDESGDAPWSSETDPWTNSSSWSKASPWPQAETEAAQPPATFVDTPLQLLTNQEREQQPSKDTFLLKSELPPNKQEPPASSKEFDSDREPAQKTSRRLEVDLLERFQCFQLPLLVLVRSR